MYGPALAHPAAAALLSFRKRPLGLRTQMMARGPGWRLADGEAGSWMIKLVRCDDPLTTWAHLLRVIRELSSSHGMRAAVLDLREVERLAGACAQAAGLLFAEFENRGVRVVALVGHDLVHAARLHSVLAEHAMQHGRCCLTEADAIEWVRGSAPPVPPPLRCIRRPAFAPPTV